ncbi:MAG: hypothetical protein JNL01_07170 [Bdellovibrionales bacterium]|nr:hypothetical protein [Bdellovibrionales bacterium]
MILRSLAWAAFGLGFSSSALSAISCRERLLSVMDIDNYYQSQLQPELLEHYPGTPGICGATCVTNTVRILDAFEGIRSARKKRKGILETIHWVEWFKKYDRRGDVYNPLTDGVSFENMLRTIAKREETVFKGIQFFTKTMDPYEGSDRKRLEELDQGSEAIRHSFRDIVPADIRNLDIDIFMFSFVHRLESGKVTDFAHAVVGIYDPKKDWVKVLDPYFPDDPSYWKFEKGAEGFHVGLKRVSGPYIENQRRVVVNDFIGLKLPD